MNQTAISFEQQATISSLEIAELTGKQHSHVLRDIRVLLSRLGLGQNRFAGKYRDVSSRWRPLFNLPQRELDQLLIGYGLDVRAKVVDHWHQLEVASAPVVSVAPRVEKAVLTLVPQVAKPSVQGEFLTMSSVEIAELTGKRPVDVMRDIRSMLDDLGVDERKFASIYFDSYKREKPCFALPRRETDILLTGYSVSLRAKVIDRWRELEAEVAKPINLSDASSLRGLLLGYTEQVLQLEHKISEDKPKVEFYDNVVVAIGTHSV